MRVGVGFDLDHTLAIDNKLERVAFLRLLELVLEHGGHTMGTLGAEQEHIDALLALQRSGAFSIDDAVRRFVLERGIAITEPYVEHFRTYALEMAGDFVIPLPGARKTLDALAERGFAVAVLSNGWNPLQNVKAMRVGFEGPVIASADIGAQKPDARAFEALLATLGTPASQTYYVGDDPHADVAGALEAGINPIWLDAEGQIYPSQCPQPQYRLSTLDELLALLPARGDE